MSTFVRFKNGRAEIDDCNVSSSCTNCKMLTWENQSRLIEIHKTLGQHVREADKLKMSLNNLYEEIGKMIQNAPFVDSSKYEAEQDQMKLEQSNYEHDPHQVSSTSSKPSHIIPAQMPENYSCPAEPSTPLPKNKRGRKRKGKAIVSPTKNVKADQSPVQLSPVQVPEERRTLRPRNSKGQFSLTEIFTDQEETGSKEIHQPAIYINPNLFKVKIEQDYNPVVMVKAEPFDPDDAYDPENPTDDWPDDFTQYSNPQISRRQTVLNNWLNSPLNNPRPDLPVEELVFSESSILVQIMESAKFSDLKTCRLVNQTWQMSSSTVIRDRDCCKVKILCDDDGTVFLHNKDKGEMLDMLQNPMDLPCSDFIFSGNGTLAVPMVQTFLDIHGSRIRTLEIDMNSIRTPNIVLHDILHRQAPNIHSLTIRKLNYMDWSDVGTFFLPNLKILEWQDATLTAHKLIEFSPNLTSVKGFNLDLDVDKFMGLNKIHTVKELIVTGNESPLATLKFASANPKCEKLDLRGVTPDLCFPIQKLLEVTKGTLVSLRVGENCLRDEIKVPELKKLKILDLGQNKGHPCFPVDINLQKCFPNIHTLDCSGLSSIFSWTVYFPPSDSVYGKLKTVKTLKIEDCWNQWMFGFSTLCPNFTKLVVRTDQCFKVVLPKVIRLCSHLESLVLEARSEGNVPVALLDSVITGLSEEICGRLRARDTDNVLPGFEMLRFGQSIVNFKELKRLRFIGFNCEVTVEDFPLTRVSGIYGFGLVPGLKTVIEVPSYFSESDLTTIQKILVPFATVQKMLK